MQRYFVDRSHIREGTIRITGEDARHIAKVMRSQVGDAIVCCDGTGMEYTAVLTAVQEREAEARIAESGLADSEPRHRLWVAQSLPKGDKMETVLQKGTEIGATRFVPFVSARTVVQYDERKEAKRLERWRKIVKEAAEQAHRAIMPQVDEPLAWRELLQLAATADAALICYEKERGLGFKEALRRAIAGRTASAEQALTLLVIIGPEGGFAEEEIGEAERAGCVPVSLGKRILRTETAALVGLSFIVYETE